MIPLLAAVASVVCEDMTIYSIIPPKAGLGLQLELFELAQVIPSHYHKLQKQYLLVTDGVLEVVYGKEKQSLLLQSGDLFILDPGTVHSVFPKEKAQFLSLDMPGLEFPEDVFYGEPNEELQWIFSAKNPSILDSSFVGPKIDLGEYAVYELITGMQTQEKWSVALLEIQNSPRHFHKKEKEHFVVVEGSLFIEVNGFSKVLTEGDFITILPEQIHQLQSALRSDPVRVLCFSFPAFHPDDMYLVE